MSIRDLLLAILLIFNCYFAYTIYDLKAETKKSTVTSELDTQIQNSDSTNYEYYTALYMFKQIIPEHTFNEELLPEIETMLKDGTINATEWTTILQKITSLKEENIDFQALYLEAMKEKGLGSTLEEMLSSMANDVSDIGGSLKENLEDFIEKNKLNEEQSTSPKQSTDKGVAL